METPLHQIRSWLLCALVIECSLRENDMMKLRKRPLSVSQCVSMLRSSRFEKEGHLYYRDVMLHAVLFVGLNLRLRFDELNELK